MTMLFHGSRGESWMRAFYDMSMRDACHISGVSTAALKRIRDKKDLATWPFQGMKQGGEINAMEWELIRRHREALLATPDLPGPVRVILHKARDWGRLQRRIHDRSLPFESGPVEELPAFPSPDPAEWAFLYPGDDTACETLVFE